MPRWSGVIPAAEGPPAGRAAAIREDQEMMVNSTANQRRARIAGIVSATALVLAVGPLTGCEVDSFFDPSRTGYFEPTPTTIEVLDRIDVIEPEDDLWGEVTRVRPDDLLPSDLTYYMSASDIVTVEIFELYEENTWARSTRRVDAGGFLRIPEIGDVPAAGLTPQQFEDDLRDRLRTIIVEPQVDVVVEEFSGFTFTIYGATASPGVYTLRNPDLRLLDAMAISGAIPATVTKVYVVRELALTDDVKPSWETGGRPPAQGEQQRPPVDIEELIEKLPDRPGGGGPPSLGAMRQDPAPTQPPPVDIEDVEPERRTDFAYDPQRDEWVGPELILERVIEIDYERLERGDSSYNIVIRPNDRIWVPSPDVGVIYIDGEVVRPGVYSMPAKGKLTLSRLVAAAGGLGPLAIPERVDLTRVVGESKEATVRLNLGGIRARTEPDVALKADDHIIIGTNWLATPLAIIRSGFRMTYGFGFLLDRNFGADVFGPPPESSPE